MFLDLHQADLIVSLPHNPRFLPFAVGEYLLRYLAFVRPLYTVVSSYLDCPQDKDPDYEQLFILFEE
jgi:hypothetical protein